MYSYFTSLSAKAEKVKIYVNVDKEQRDIFEKTLKNLFHIKNISIRWPNKFALTVMPYFCFKTQKPIFFQGRRGDAFRKKITCGEVF